MGTKVKVSKDVASKTILKWLDFKQVDDEKREEQESSIKTMVNAVVYGNLIMDDKCNFIYNLKFPLEDEGGSVVLDKLKFKPRMKTSEADDKMKNLKNPSTYEMVRCFTAALTGENMGTLKLMDSEDTRVVNAISAFFL